METQASHSLRLGFLALIISVVLAAPGIAIATHDPGIFELDGNATSAASAGDDWSALFPVDRTTREIAKVFVADGINSPADSSFYAGGGSKDIYDLSEWRHSSGDVAPDKDEIGSAWAVAYDNPIDTGANDAGDLMLYFGADRFANSGDAQIGFWFLRGNVGRSPDGTFSGAHTRDDLLVLSDFTQGGRVSSVRAYRWVGSGGSDGSLHLLATGRDCLDSSADDALCAEVNASATTSPWPFTPKSGSAGTFPRGSFYEGGLNVSRLVPGLRCFGSYLAETRSSQSVSAQLKDLALGAFNTCSRSSAPVRASGGSPAGSSLRPGPMLPATGRRAGAVASLLLGVALIAAGSAARRATGRSR